MVQWIIFLRVGAPPHFPKEIRAHLDLTFPSKWTGRGGPTALFPPSSDLTNSGLSLLGFVNKEARLTV